MTWTVTWTKEARKDLDKSRGSPLRKKLEKLLAVIEQDPFQDPPPFKFLVHNLEGWLSRRISQQHRLVYQVFPATEDQQDAEDFVDDDGNPFEGTVVIRMCWRHYGD